MTNKERAKIFLPFDALKGFRESLRQQEKIKVKKRIASDDYAEELNQTLIKLKKGMLIKVLFYQGDQEDYTCVEGILTKIDEVNKIITIVKTNILINDIYQIDIIEEKGI